MREYTSARFELAAGHGQPNDPFRDVLTPGGCEWLQGLKRGVTYLSLHDLVTFNPENDEALHRMHRIVERLAETTLSLSPRFDARPISGNQIGFTAYVRLPGDIQTDVGSINGDFVNYRMMPVCTVVPASVVVPPDTLPRQLGRARNKLDIYAHEDRYGVRPVGLYTEQKQTTTRPARA